MSALIAVVVAFLANGEMDYAAMDAKDHADCKQKVEKIAHHRLAQNEHEEVKVLGFEFECVEFENKFGVAAPVKPASEPSEPIPGDRAA